MNPKLKLFKKMLKPGYIKLYNASAGSGKTYTLVQEIMLLILSSSNSDLFKNILSITFTNKATNEMKSRILEKLVELSNGEGVEFYEKELKFDKKILIDRAKKVKSNILHQYSLLSISTIDKFNLRIMRAFSQDLGLAINFDVEMEVKDIMFTSADLLFSELEKGSELTNVISDLAVQNLKSDKQWDISSDMVNKADKLFKDQYINDLGELQKLSLNDLIRFREFVISNFYGLKSKMKNIAREMINDFSSRGIDESDFKHKSSGSIYTIYKNILRNIFNPISKRQKGMLENGDYFGKNLELYDLYSSKISETISEIENCLSEYTLFSKLINTVGSITMVNELEKIVNEFKEDNNILLISEFNKIISDGLRGEPAPFIYERIGSRYHHYFIDEFQDTSNIQWQNMEPLIEDAISQDKTVMLVGDPKQSIYRFRGANSKLMIDMINSNDNRIEVENLPINWRSYDKIIEFNNHFYTEIANYLGNEEFKDIYKIGSKQEPNHKKGGYVEYMLLKSPQKGSGISYKEVALEAFYKQLTAALESGFSYKEIAVLVKSKSEGSLIAEYLSSKGIQVLSEESLLLDNSLEVRLLLDFMWFLSDMDNTVFKANFIIRLEQFGLIESDNITELIKEFVKHKHEDFYNNLNKIGVDIKFLLDSGISFYDQIILAVKAFKLDKNGNTYVNFFMDEVLQFQQKNEATPKAFLDMWEAKKKEKSITVPKGEDAVQLMTIHKSKGLQFPVVFLPFLPWEIKCDGVWVPINNEKISRFYIEGFSNMELLSDEIQKIMLEEEDNSILDALNTIYVATTRAEEQLYMIVQEGGGSSISGKMTLYLNKYFNSNISSDSDKITFGEQERATIASKSKSNIIQYQIPMISEDWNSKIAISNEHNLLWNEERAKAIDYGNQIHAIMEKLNHKSNLENLLSEFVLNGFISEEIQTDIKSKINEIINHPLLKEAFETEDFLNERDFINSEGEIFRPDRLSKIGDKWTLIDYKTGDFKQGHKNQINRYKSDLNELGFIVDKSFLVYLDREEYVLEVI